MGVVGGVGVVVRGVGDVGTIIRFVVGARVLWGLLRGLLLVW